MPTYNVDVIHEATGMYMNFTYESDAPHEDALCSEVLSDLSVVAFKLEE
jgi:hypothetical protein